MEPKLETLLPPPPPLIAAVSTPLSTAPPLAYYDHLNSANVHQSVPIYAYFNLNQIECMCEALQQADNCMELANFPNSLPMDEELRTNNIVLKARAYIAFKQNEFEKLFDIIQYNTFDVKYHPYLQTLWLEGHYQERKQLKKLNRDLTAVEKHRIRIKNPLPRSIWDGKSHSFYFSEETRKILIKHYSIDPFLSMGRRAVIRQKMGLVDTQIQNWFKNRRQRERLKIRKTTEWLETNKRRIAMFNC